MDKKNVLCWIRRDLRLHDHYALSEALKRSERVYLVFVFDSCILKNLSDKNDPRLTFIVDSLKEMESALQKYGSSIILRAGDPVEEIPKVVEDFGISEIFFNRDYEPYAKKRDARVETLLRGRGIGVTHFKDHVFYEKKEIANGEGKPYKVFTPYKKKWLESFREQAEVIPFYVPDLNHLASWNNPHSIHREDWLAKIGFVETPPFFAAGTQAARERLEYFKNFIALYKDPEAPHLPFRDQTSHLSVYLRMGNLSVRDLLRLATSQKTPGHEEWFSEIIWRDFYQMILDQYPGVETHSFKLEYEAIKWQGEKEHFKKWCDGETGFPLIDAAMRCLNVTGFMPNRLRMVVASFLTKTLLLDWRWGERYFAERLLDYDLAANNGGWQWCASTGVDAQPYFRIFNPFTQSKKFDPEGDFIREWCPELAGFDRRLIHSPIDADRIEQEKAQCFIGHHYPSPLVSYSAQRKRALSMYQDLF